MVCIVIAYANWFIWICTNKTDYDFLNIAQRVIHFGICLFVSFYFYRERVVLEYNDTDLVVVDKLNKETYSIPLKAFTGIKLKPTFVRTAGKTFTYELTFMTRENAEESLTFKTYPSKKLRHFIEILKAANPQLMKSTGFFIKISFSYFEPFT